MAEPATKTKAADKPTDADLEKLVSELRADNQELREMFVELKNRDTVSPEQVEAEAQALADAQLIADALAGGRGGTLTEIKPTRTEVRDAIKTIRADLRKKLAAKRDLQPEEMQTMTVGLREHIAGLNESAEMYYEREGI